MIDQLLEWPLERVGRQVHDPGEDARDEAATDHGAGASHRLGFG